MATLAELHKTLLSLSEGDRIAVTTRKYGRRELSVTADPHRSPGTESISVHTTSGKTWDSRMRGGVIRYLSGKTSVLLFQPSMRQEVDNVDALEKIGVVNPAGRRRNGPGLDANKPITRAHYPAIFGDTDTDKIPDVDDPRPRIPGDKHSIEEVRLADEIDALLAERQAFMPVLEEIKGRLYDLGIEGAEVKGRVKTPFSILNKLRRKRLSTLTDVAGAAIIVPDQAALDRAKRSIERDFEIIDREDYYADPQNGYRALHYIVRVQGKPVELQLKTSRMAAIAKSSHTAYKRGALNAEAMEHATSLAWKADRGDEEAAAEIDYDIEHPQELRRKLTARNGNPRTRELARRLARGEA